jgi:hypothetical protein
MNIQTPKLTRDQAMQMLLNDRLLYIETMMHVENKYRQVVPFMLNPIQLQMHKQSTGRDVSVKPAQVGGTTYYIGDFLADCVLIPGTTSVIISYDEFITGRLLRKAQMLYDNLVANPQYPFTIPKLNHKSTFEKTFVFEDSKGYKRGESSMYISSARGFSMPRGEPIHNLLLDEFSFWPKGAAQDVFAASLQRVPLTQKTKVRVVSTPNGEDNAFHEIYLSAKEGKEYGRSIFKSHFFEWYQMPEYSMQYDSPFCLPGDDIRTLENIQPDEKVLLQRWEKLGIDEEEQYNKLRWRRYKIAEMASLRRSGETSLLFWQEYPEDDVSCFQMAGNEYFDGPTVSAMIKNCFPAPYHMHEADIWYLPEENHKYLVALDPGIAKVSESVATVWDFGTEGTFKHCATLAGLWADDILAEKAMALGRFYNTNGSPAVLATEDALGIVAHIKHYPNLYYRTDPETGKMSNNIGWYTSRTTKPYMLLEMNRNLDKIETHDARIPSQMRNIRIVGGKAEPVGADDFVMSTAIAIVCRESIPIVRGVVDHKGWDW